MESATFGIGEVAARTGVAEGTLRMWERRHGFPAPARLAGGHRRYSEREVEQVRRVAAQRAAGVPLAVAIERAARGRESTPASIYAALRRRRPDLEALALPKPTMVALSRAIEDECVSRAQRPLLFAAFQRERNYRRDERRWRELSRGAQATFAFADFARVRRPRGGPVEIPLRADHPLGREWAVVCDADDRAVCLSGWERPGAGARVFEAFWTVEPELVREAARICAGLVAARGADLAEALRPRLEGAPVPVAGEQLRLAAAITNRTLSYLR
jgi:MerR family transcriptional regulator, light-induced transcriptional regulator